MSVLQGLTLSQMEDQVARNLMGIQFVSSTTTGLGSFTTLVDTGLSGGLDSRIGSWIIFTSGLNDGLEREASDHDGVLTVTFKPGLSNSVLIGTTYKMFDREGKYKSSLIRNAINDAVTYAAGRWYKPEESVALHADGVQSRFDIPSEFDGIRKVEYRRSHRDQEIHSCDTTFATVTDADFTQSVDGEDKKRGGGSLKLVIAGTVSDGDVVAAEITALDLSKYTHLEGWCKATTALAAADFVVQLREGAGTTRETLSVPAVAADTWTFFRVALGNPELDTAIDRIYLEYNANSGGNTVWFDDIRAVDDNSGNWVLLNDGTWLIDHEARDLILKPSALAAVGYALLKITGGSIPTTMAAGTTTATVPEEFLIARATADLLFQTGDERAALWQARARQARFGLRLPPNLRRIRG